MPNSYPIKTEEIIVENAEYNSTEELEEEIQLQLEDSGGESYHIQYQSDTQLTPISNSRQQNHKMSSGGKTNTSTGGSSSGVAPKNMLESEKRMRREIANSNERRRMQSINAGFQNLRSLLPRHEGEKLSKAAILQQTSQYICELENQKTQLLAQNSQLKRQLGQHDPSGGGGGGSDTNTTIETANGVTIKKRKLTDNVISVQTISDSSDEGLGSMSPEPMTLLNNASGTGTTITTKSQLINNATIIAHNSKELFEMKKQLDKERRMRAAVEEELQSIKRQLYSVATAPPQSSSSNYIPREVIEHTDNIIRDNIDDLPAGTVSYVEIDEVTGQQQVVVCSSIEELDSESAAAADIITEDNVQEEVILSSSSSTESEQEVNAIARAYASGGSPNSADLQPILQAAIKATPKVEVEHIKETIIRVKTEKIEQPVGITRSRQNLETIVEAIRHLEGDHLFSDGTTAVAVQQHRAQEAPLALTNKQQTAASQRATLAELRPFLQLKGNKQVTICGTGGSVTLTHQQLAAAGAKVVQGTSTTLKQDHKNDNSSNNTTSITSSSAQSATVLPTAILKVQTSSTAANSEARQVTITTSALNRHCRPGVIVAKKLS